MTEVIFIGIMALIIFYSEYKRRIKAKVIKRIKELSDRIKEYEVLINEAQLVTDNLDATNHQDLIKSSVFIWAHYMDTKISLMFEIETLKNKYKL